MLRKEIVLDEGFTEREKGSEGKKKKRILDSVRKLLRKERLVVTSISDAWPLYRRPRRRGVGFKG